MTTGLIRYLRNTRASARSWIAESPSTRDPRLLLYYWRRFGLLKTLGFRLYDDSFFADNLPLKDAYADLANVVYSAFMPESACDFGCGNAFLIFFLKQAGVKVHGVEGSRSAMSYIPDDIKGQVDIASVTRPLSLGAFDLVISTEVAEHIPKVESVRLIDNLVYHAKRGIFFTAAHPGQWGDGHINCQPKQYWEQLFRARGWCVHAILQEQIKQAIRERPRIDAMLPWVSSNMLALIPANSEVEVA
jgi:hypothetical protein